MKNKRFWDVIFVSDKGEWVGFRSPLSSLNRLAGYFSLLVLAFALSFVGWLLSRWQVERMGRQLAHEQLKLASLESQVTEKSTGGISKSPLSETFTLLPALNDKILKSNLVDLKNVQADFNYTNHEMALKFEINRSAPAVGRARFYWVAILHGSQGILFFPPVFGSQSGEAIMFQRGHVAEDVNLSRSVEERFNVEGFFERSGSEPIYVSLVLYDSKGSMLTYQRYPVALRRSAEKGST